MGTDVKLIGLQQSYNRDETSQCAHLATPRTFYRQRAQQLSVPIVPIPGP
jgi:hypothetical protein